jgi:outer membrane protein OmpA-like peptidoglycan-associated protein
MMEMILGLALGASLYAQPANACPHEAMAREAYNAGDHVRAERAAFEAREDGRCTREQAAMAGRLAALLALGRAYEDPDPEARLSQLTAALDLGQPWQVLSAIAMAHREAGRFDRAHAFFDAAFMDAADETLTPDWMAPSAEQAEQLFALKQEMHLASGEALSSRSGCVMNQRGFETRRRSQPVQFAFDSVAFTEEGARNADLLRRCLVTMGSPAITLTGHTDQVGQRGYNCELSVRRAQAVRRYLIDQGYSGTVRIDGRGMDAPYRPTDGFEYAPDLRRQMDRRVDLEIHDEDDTPARDMASCRG